MQIIYNILLRSNQEDETNSKSTQVHHVWTQRPLNEMLLDYTSDINFHHNGLIYNIASNLKSDFFFRVWGQCGGINTNGHNCSFFQTFDFQVNQ
jgi:hypothetical protein